MSRGRYPRRIKLKGLDLTRLDRYLDIWDPADLHFRPESFPLLDSVSLFGSTATLSLDLGCGTGEFLCGLARSKAEEFFLGIDSAKKPLIRAAVQAADLGLENVRFLRADFRQAVRRMKAESFAAVYLQFPLPGSTAQGYRPRIFDPEFVREVHRVLAPGGRLSVLTDREPAWREMIRLLERVGGFDQIQETEFEVQIEGDLRSHNYSVWTGRGYTPYQFEAVKSAVTRIDRFEPSGGIHGSIGN